MDLPPKSWIILIIPICPTPQMSMRHLTSQQFILTQFSTWLALRSISARSIRSNRRDWMRGAVNIWTLDTPRPARRVGPSHRWDLAAQRVLTLQRRRSSRRKMRSGAAMSGPHTAAQLGTLKWMQRWDLVASGLMPDEIRSPERRRQWACQGSTQMRSDSRVGCKLDLGQGEMQRERERMSANWWVKTWIVENMDDMGMRKWISISIKIKSDVVQREHKIDFQLSSIWIMC